MARKSKFLPKENRIPYYNWSEEFHTRLKLKRKLTPRNGALSEYYERRIKTINSLKVFINGKLNMNKTLEARAKEIKSLPEIYEGVEIKMENGQAVMYYLGMPYPPKR